MTPTNTTYNAARYAFMSTFSIVALFLLSEQLYDRSLGNLLQESKLQVTTLNFTKLRGGLRCVTFCHTVHSKQRCKYDAGT